MEIALMLLACAGAGWMVMPPRSERRGWLAGALLLLWLCIMAVGWRRGVLPGYEGWLALLALMAALAALLALWSLVNLRRPS